MKKILAGAIVALLAVVGGQAEAQYYKGKRITILINYSAGGPTDIEARLVAKHFAKHIPGNPRIIAKNMPGAGGIIGSNFMGEVAKPDGQTIAIFTPPVISQLLNDPGLRVDFNDFVWLAGIGHPQVCYVRKDVGSGINKLEDLIGQKGFKAAGMHPTSSHDIRLRMGLDLLGAEYKYVTGYRGLAKVAAAVMQNESQYSCGSVPGYRKNVEPNLIKSGDAMTLWYYSVVDDAGNAIPNPHLTSIPTFLDVYKKIKGEAPTGTLWETFRLVNNISVSMLRGSFAPKGTPEAAVKDLRAAWEALADDKEFASDYEKVIKAPPNLVQAAEAQAHIAATQKVSSEVVAFLREFVKTK